MAMQFYHDSLPNSQVPELTKLAEQRAHASFVQGYKSTEEEALGLVIATHFGWDGAAIMRVFAAALEDANFHTEAAHVNDAWLKED